jgi:N-glycosylase/DNA lyase
MAVAAEVKKGFKIREQRMEEVIRMYQERRPAIRQRLDEFSRIPPSEYFYELVYCLLTPQSSAVRASMAINSLRRAAFESRDIDPEPLLRRREHYIRFHKTKAKHLIRLKRQFPLIAAALAKQRAPSDLRKWLAENVSGLGYKEATHFLRNVGKNDCLAILDRHILRSLKRLGVIRSIPKFLNRRQYFEIERRFAEFAGNIGIPLDELDLLFWSIETGEIRK